MAHDGWNPEQRRSGNSEADIFFHHRQDNVGFVSAKGSPCAPQGARMKIHPLQNRLEWKESAHALFQHAVRRTEYRYVVTAFRETPAKHLGHYVNAAPFDR